MIKKYWILGCVILISCNKNIKCISDIAAIDNWAATKEPFDYYSIKKNAVLQFTFAKENDNFFVEYECIDKSTDSFANILKQFNSTNNKTTKVTTYNNFRTDDTALSAPVLRLLSSKKMGDLYNYIDEINNVVCNKDTLKYKPNN